MSIETPLVYTILLQWLAVLFYGAGIICDVPGVLFQKKRLGRIAHKLMFGGFLLHSGALFVRWIMTGHGPYVVRHEIFSSDSWVTLLLYALFLRYFPRSRPVSLLLFPAVFLLLGLALFQDPALSTLPPTLKSIWLVLHVLFYKISVGTFLTALSFGAFTVLKKAKAYPWLHRLPNAAVCDSYSHRFAGFAFIFWTLATLAGSIWAYDSWGRYWGWDPIETWSFLTWLLLGGYLHMRRFFGLKDGKAALLLFCCFLFSLIALFFVPLLDPALHTEYLK